MLAPANSLLAPQRDPAWRGRVAVFALAVILLWPALVLTEFQPWILADAQSLHAAGRFLADFFPPAHSAEFLKTALQATWQTIAIATSGLVLALLGAIPCTLVVNEHLSTSRVGRKRPGAGALLLRQAVRWLLVALRSVPELVWALLFVSVVGLGPTAGVLAIALTYCGMLGKVYAEILEASDVHATDVLLQNGSSRLTAFLYGALPNAAPELLSYTIYRWECAIRGSVVMGFVGAGGLGQMMDQSIKMLAGGEISAMLIIFVLLVAAADGVSKFLRKSLDAGGDAQALPQQGPGPAVPPAPRRITPLVAITLLALVALVVASFTGLPLEWQSLLTTQAASQSWEFLLGFAPPDLSPGLLAKVSNAALETLAMSALSTAIAAIFGLLLALPASGRLGTWLQAGTRLLLNVARAIPELVWASIMLIAAGLGPFAGTLALAAHTSGVLGRLFAEALENASPLPENTLRINGAGAVSAFLYATLPQRLPQMLSYALYRWENNIRAAAILGVVGAGGLGQMLKYHLSLFQMQTSATVIVAMLLLVALVDALSFALRRWLVH